MCKLGTPMAWEDLMLRVARANCPHSPYKTPISQSNSGHKRDRTPSDIDARDAKRRRDHATRRGRNHDRNLSVCRAKGAVRTIHNVKGGCSSGKGQKKTRHD